MSEVWISDEMSPEEVAEAVSSEPECTRIHVDVSHGVADQEYKPLRETIGAALGTLNPNAGVSIHLHIDPPRVHEVELAGLLGESFGGLSYRNSGFAFTGDKLPGSDKVTGLEIDISVMAGPPNGDQPGENACLAVDALRASGSLSNLERLRVNGEDFEVLPTQVQIASKLHKAGGQDVGEEPGATRA